MTLADGLIPTFQPGDKVLVTPRPREGYECPHCHESFYEQWERTGDLSVNGEVIGPLTAALRCTSCNELSTHEGLLRVAIDVGFVAVPCPWLRRIEDES